MKLASGTIASLVLTVGALLILAAVDSADNVMNFGRRPPKTSYLRSGSSRKLYNYSRNNNNANYNGYSGSYGGSYGGNYGGNNNGGNYGGNYGGNNNNADNYNNGGNGGNYANYDDNNGYNNDGSYNYIWQRDDDDNYGNDDASYYNSNKNYQADGSSYNGRDQQWGGQSVQSYSDDEVVEVELEEYDEDDRWEILGKFGGLNGAETFAVASLAALVSLCVVSIMMLVAGYNIIDLCNYYCCKGIFSHKDQRSGESVDDGFVKLGDN